MGRGSDTKPVEAHHGKAGDPGAAAASGPSPERAMWARDAASQGLGMELLSSGDGAARVRMTVTAAMVNGHGVAHGGFLFTLADTAFALACNSRGPVTVGAGADIDFLAPAFEGDVLVAEAAERARFGRSGLYDVRIERDDPQHSIVVEFRGRSRVIRGVEETA
ncbi:hydroxyphenylacetyl-CoA thioesterase PaaI [Streptomyces sp. NPDC007088]|uniref:hydroxyphenylacetyl-CoA thioesterase PaaI n=1 Tax=Streptomyces sp. NPDC007088 TaxID=3364773 RepID=UPI0036A1BA57